jgi:GNAT superfamily N-acetyltransferase
MRMPTVEPLGTIDRDRGLDEAAELLAREHVRARGERPGLPAAYAAPERCHQALGRLVGDAHVFLARDKGTCVGIVFGRTIDAVGFVPAEGFAVDPAAHDPTAIVVGLFAELMPALVAEGARRFTVDHVDLAGPGIALHDLGFGRGAVFATRPVRPTPATASGIDIRIATPDDLDSVARLSRVEHTQRSAPPIYSAPRPTGSTDVTDLSGFREHHRRLLDDGAVHLLARHHDADVGLLTLEPTTPAPRLCPAGQPYIGPTATDPAVRGRGIGRALVDAAHDWAHRNGHHTMSVDFEPSNPLSRPFWLGLGFRPSGYRQRRTIGHPTAPG